VADVSIPREAVDKAARALVESNTLTYKTWDEMNDGQRRLWRQRAEVVLNAGGPLIVAPHMDKFAVELKQRAEARDAVDADAPDLEECEHGGDCHTDAAVSTWLRAAWWAERNANELRAQS
jgi:hypothetical protein